MGLSVMMTNQKFGYFGIFLLYHSRQGFLENRRLPGFKHRPRFGAPKKRKTLLLKGH